MTLPLDRFCNAVEWWSIQRVKDYDDFMRKLNAPPANTRGRKAEPSQEELDENAAALAAFGGMTA